MRALAIGQVHPGVGDGGGGLLHHRDRSVRRQRAGEEPDAAVQVDEVGAVSTRVPSIASPTAVDERLRAVGPGLEERPRRDAPTLARPPPRGTRPAGPPPAPRPTRRGRPRAPGWRPTSTLTTTRRSPVRAPGPEHHLPVGEATVGDQLVDERMGHEARRHRDRIVAVAAPEPEPPVRPRRRGASCGSPVAGRSGPSSTSTSSLAWRRSASATMAALSRRWAAGATCCQSHPPQPAATKGTARPTRSGDASITSSTRAAGEVLLLLVELHGDTLSPGRAPVTNVTRPSAIASHPVAAGHDRGDLQGQWLHGVTVGACEDGRR